MSIGRTNLAPEAEIRSQVGAARQNARQRKEEESKQRKSDGSGSPNLSCLLLFVASHFTSVQTSVKQKYRRCKGGGIGFVAV